MPVHFDADSGKLAVFNERRCPGCAAEDSLTDTGCDAPDCNGYECSDCGWGCDRDTAGEAGRCGRAAAAESDEDYAARVAAERAAFGLPPL